MLNTPQIILPSSSPTRPTKSNVIPKWEAELSAAVAKGIIAKGVFEWSSATRGELIFTSEFDISGQIPVRFESRPSPLHWGAVDISIVVDPHENKKLNERPGDIVPMFTRQGVRQGEATAIASIHDGDCARPGITFLYVSRRFRKRWQHVRGL